MATTPLDTSREPTASASATRRRPLAVCSPHVSSAADVEWSPPVPSSRRGPSGHSWLATRLSTAQPQRRNGNATTRLSARNHLLTCSVTAGSPPGWSPHWLSRPRSHRLARVRAEPVRVATTEGRLRRGGGGGRGGGRGRDGTLVRRRFPHRSVPRLATSAPPSAVIALSDARF